MAQTITEPNYMLLPEVAELARIPVATLYKLRANGRGPRGARLGRRLVFNRQDVIDWIASHAETTTP